MPPKTKPSGTRTCLMCKQSVVDAIFCSVCDSPYHPGCASRVRVLDNGAYSKCCGPRSPLPSTQFDSSSSQTQPTNQSQQTTDNSVETIINNAISGLQLNMNANFSSLHTSISELKTNVESLTSKMERTISTVNDHSTRIAEIEGTINGLRVDSISRDCMTEIQSRLSRSNNLILFGFNEVIPEVDKNLQTSAEFNISDEIVKLFSVFSPPSLTTNLKALRIGKFAQAQKRPRPVKIICSSMEVAKALHKAFLEAKRVQTYGPLLQGMRLSWDLTRLQLEEMSFLRKEVDSRRLAGETHARVVFRQGVPHIITTAQKQNPPRNEQAPLSL